MQHAGLTSNIPFGGDYSDSVILAEGYQMAPGESLISPYRISVSPGYFEAMGIPTLAYGRVFNDSDTDSSPLVSSSWTRSWHVDSGARANPVGRRMFKPDNAKDITTPGPKARWFTVVGVVAEVRISGFVAADDRVGAYYFPHAQETDRGVTLTIKSAGDPMALTPLVRRELAAIDPELPLYNVHGDAGSHRPVAGRPADADAAGADVRRRRALSCRARHLRRAGLSSIAAHGERSASGWRSAATPSRIFRMVLGEGLVLLGIGFAAGLAMAVAARGALQTQLYGVGALDPRVSSLSRRARRPPPLIACISPRAPRRADRSGGRVSSSVGSRTSDSAFIEPLNALNSEPSNL